MAIPPNEPPYLPPRRPTSAIDIRAKRLSQTATPPYLPSRPVSLLSPTRGPLIPAPELSHVPYIHRGEREFSDSPPTSRNVSAGDQAGAGASQHLTSDISQHSLDVDTVEPVPRPSRPHPVARHSSLLLESKLSQTNSTRTGLGLRTSFDRSAAISIQREAPSRRPRSHPCSRSGSMYRGVDNSSPTDVVPIPAIPPHMQMPDAWSLPPLQQPMEKSDLSRSSSRHSTGRGPIVKPRASFSRLSSLDNLITYHEEKAAWKRASSYIQSPAESYCERHPTLTSEPDTLPIHLDDMSQHKRTESPPASGAATPDFASRPVSAINPDSPPHQNRFRHVVAELGFCFTIAMTQFLAEYMISGFAIELPKLIARHTSGDDGGMGKFWPASLLSLILSATLLIFARISDMYGGYFPFMFGVMWLGVWSLVAGFAGLGTLLDVARAMQGLAIAAFTPATFAMVGSIYPDGHRKNTVLGMYAGCAPLGFFGGFLVAGALPEGAQGWYFWTAAVLAFTTAITAYLTVPHDRTDRKQLALKMDWAGAGLITAGLILLAYALAVEPYANASDSSRPGWSFPMVLAPLVCGVTCLGIAFWVEGWYAKCPLLPFDFFVPKNTKSFSLAALCFYATYGVWLYESAQFFQNAHATGTEDGIHGITLAIWYTPTAVGGLLLCVASGRLLHIVPITLALLISGLAWIASPLLLALCPLPLSYWPYVMPSMLCATIGIDLTFTISCIFLSAVQPIRYQGLAGAISSILVNLAMSFSLSISEIVSEKGRSTVPLPSIQSPEYAELANEREMQGFRAAFVYGAASAGLGFIICVVFVRISRHVVDQKPMDEERPTGPRPSSEASTLVDGGDR